MNIIKRGIAFMQNALQNDKNVNADEPAVTNESTAPAPVEPGPTTGVTPTKIPVRDLDAEENDENEQKSADLVADQKAVDSDNRSAEEKRADEAHSEDETTSEPTEPETEPENKPVVPEDPVKAAEVEPEAAEETNPVAEATEVEDKDPYASGKKIKNPEPNNGRED